MMRPLLLSLLLTAPLAARADDPKEVGAIGGHCKEKAEAAVRKKFKMPSKRVLVSTEYSDTPGVFTLGFGLPNDDCQFFYDVTVKVLHTVPGKDDLDHPTQEAVACEVEKVEKSSDSEDCG